MIAARLKVQVLYICLVGHRLSHLSVSLVQGPRPGPVPVGLCSRLALHGPGLATLLSAGDAHGILGTFGLHQS